jgi:energy-coupling factor transporter ATP-binding protein EcfA2
VLEDVNLKIPYNKITAIVGASGSGKTTLVKLLLAYYQPNKGNINLGETPIKNINPSAYTPNNLTEIGWGINYLIKNRFVDAGASVLEEVDTFLCKLKHEDILSKTDSSYPFFSKDLYLMDRGYSTELLKISLLELKELLGQKDRRFHLCYLNSILYTILQMNTDTELYNTVLNILYTNIVNSIGNKYYFPVDVLVLSGIIQSFNLRRNSVTEDEKWTGLLEALDCSNTGGMIFNTGIYDLIYCKLKITKYLFNKLEITDMEKQVNFMVKDVNRNLSLHSGLAGIGLTLINNIVDNNNI